MKARKNAHDGLWDRGYERLALAIIIQAIQDLLRFPSIAAKKKIPRERLEREFLFALSAAIFLRSSPFPNQFPGLDAKLRAVGEAFFRALPEGSASGEWIRSPDAAYAIHVALFSDGFRKGPHSLVPVHVLRDARLRAGILAARLRAILDREAISDLLEWG